MSLIKLTEQSGDTLYIVADLIEVIKGAKDTNTLVSIGNGQEYYVQESPQSIAYRIRKAENNMLANINNIEREDKHNEGGV